MLQLVKIDASRNLHRFYRLEVWPTLFLRPTRADFSGQPSDPPLAAIASHEGCRVGFQPGD
jgi:hypothetical protein